MTLHLDVARARIRRLERQLEALERQGIVDERDRRRNDDGVTTQRTTAIGIGIGIGTERISSSSKTRRRRRDRDRIEHSSASDTECDDSSSSDNHDNMYFDDTHDDSNEIDDDEDSERECRLSQFLAIALALLVLGFISVIVNEHELMERLRTSIRSL